jgi:uncharacterized membrane protein YhaH (DUF805 family)
VVAGIIEAIFGERSGVTLLVYLLLLWPSLAVVAKRWHDRDKSGWWS